MKHILCFILFMISSVLQLCAHNENDSLLKVLDKVISERLIYTEKKKATIEELKSKKNEQSTLDDLYHLNIEIIHQYETFVCDSAERYIHENIGLAEKIGNPEYLLESKLKLAFVYCLSGLFVQANDILKSIHCASLPNSGLKSLYCWNCIRYYENIIKYTDDVRFSSEYALLKEAYRDTVMSVLNNQSDEYQKERAVKLQYDGKLNEALRILSNIYDKQKPETHGYAMMAMGLARAYKLSEKTEEEEKFLILAAMADTKLAVKENEALLTLAVNLYHKGDVDRAYNYIKVALDDAIFYNSRFKNTVIARIHPIIENTYLYRLEQQKQNLRLYILLISLFVVALAITLFFAIKQTRRVSRAKKNLNVMNEKLVLLNKSLDEANLIKEKYVGYFMNQCAVYINKLDEYRKNVNRKIKTGQVDELYKSSSRPFERELEELYTNFDKAFLKLYPNFVEEFNSLLKPEEQYRLDKDQLNTELRIFALIRLGITDVGQISMFLHYSVQTIYNYKSKVKRMSILDSNLFEEEVKKLGSLS
ncbi:DUF6377 domain-containing protein [uncultured Bacteroides sp.]|uniref:DUF6377 domain-containing protein n=1 Tax=uncultured Bacteroides sp. TaxID=162156 RepID=UPI0025F531B9|nr:DUF6377 domain-containing protein [uncultured Bacteroides sp.]